MLDDSQRKTFSSRKSPRNPAKISLLLLFGSHFTFQHDKKGTPLIRRAAHADLSAVRQCDFLSDGQSKAGARPILARHAIKSVEDSRVVFFRDAGALVDDAELDAVVVGHCCAQEDFTTGRRMFDGIADK